MFSRFLGFKKSLRKLK